MEVEVTQVLPSAASATLSQSTQVQAATSAQVATDTASSKTGIKPAAPPRAKAPPPIFLRKDANFVKISADCTRLHINYSRPSAVDGIKIICPNVESFRSLNRRDDSLLWMVLAILPRTDDAKKIFNSLLVVCGLSGIRIEAPFKKGGPGQCHRCQNYGHAAANCHAVMSAMSGPSLDQRVPVHSGDGGETLLC
ncbi:hypothetical protein EVAR_101824_1 [Eumeta japonica]|uniref:Uncharacterized protein n=1 Tax=Eumeta variegata TaxID=151549 RepID=A0A4C1SQH0_EUMVA|nr:hypothetical protein EVAR_101824_1 [Eumeta japonica]